MAKIATLIARLAKEAGIKADDPKLIDALSINAEIDDTIITAIDAIPLLSMDAAKNHPDLKAHFQATVYNGIDKRILELAEDGDLTPDNVAALKAEKNTNKRIGMLKEMVKTAIETKTSSADKQGLLDEVKKLNKEMADIRDLTKKEKEQLKVEFEGKLTDYAIESILGSQDYANKDLPKNVNILTAKTLLNQVLGEKKAKVTRSATGELKLINADNPDLDYLENNKSISFSDLTKSVLASNKLLAVTDPNAKQQPGNKFAKPANEGQRPDNTKVLNAYNKHLADLGISA